MTSAPPRDLSTIHPRPQLTRPRWTDLCGSWGFAYDDADVGTREGWHERDDVFDRTIAVPFPPESAASGIGDEGFHPVVWYQRTFVAPAAPGERVLLHFGAVDYRAHVWVNGRMVAVHEGGHTPFSADITDVLHPGGGDGEQVLVVRAEDLPGDLAQPRGKQDWQEQPHMVWYRRTTGIWQPVWLETVPPTRIESIRWTPHVDRSSVGLAVHLCRADEASLRLRVRLTLRGRVVADDTYAVVADDVERELPLHIPDMYLSRRQVFWSPEHPNLIEAEVTLLRGEETIDQVGSYTAMRSVRVADSRFELNDRPYFLRLVLAQNFWPESHLAAPDPDALRREVQLAKDMGFNGVRLHQKVEDPRFLYWCDRLGMLVWAEMPSAYAFSRLSVTRLTREWLEVLDRDYSHPCIIMWVPVNESWGVPQLPNSAAQRHLVRTLYHLTKAYDPTRPVVGNDGWEQIVSDVLTVHDYSSRGETLSARYGSHEALEHTIQRTQPGYRSVVLLEYLRGREPVVVSEFGGVTLNTEVDVAWPGYGAVHTPQELLARYRDLVDALLDSPAVAGFCYTQLTDTLQERNGLVTERRESKVPVEALRAINRRTSAAVPADAINAFEHGDYPEPRDIATSRRASA